MNRSFCLFLLAGTIIGCESTTDCCLGEGFFGPEVSGVVRSAEGPVSGVEVYGIARGDNDCQAGSNFEQGTVTTNQDGIYKLPLWTFGGGKAGVKVDVICVRVSANPAPETGLAPDTVFLEDITVRVHEVTTHLRDFLLGPKEAGEGHLSQR